jgi:PST family polysaccharide transporter
VTLIRTSILNGIAVLFRMLTLLGINKILAIFVGPSGYALVGQFQSAVQMITTFGSGAINTGVIRYTAENSGNEEYLKKLWKTAGTIALAGSIVSSVVIYIFHQQLSIYFLESEQYGGVFIWFAGSLTFFVFNTLLLAILNGKKELNLFVIANIVGSLISLLLTAWLTNYWQLYGALIALGIYQSIAFFVTVILCLRTDWFHIGVVFGRIDGAIARKLMKYTIMALSSAVFVPLSHILIRNHLGDNLGWQFAGYWEAMWKLSAAYLMLVTSTLSVYYLPKLSELQTPGDIRNEIKSSFKIVIPIVILSGFSIYLLRLHLIRFLFTSDFLAMDDLFFWQLIGDTIKITSWLFAYIFLAKGFMYLYVISEFIFSALFYSLIVLLLPHLGLVSTSVAHAINYVCYLIFVLCALRLKKVI